MPSACQPTPFLFLSITYSIDDISSQKCDVEYFSQSFTSHHLPDGRLEEGDGGSEVSTLLTELQLQLHGFNTEWVSERDGGREGVESLGREGGETLTV